MPALNTNKLPPNAQDLQGRQFSYLTVTGLAQRPKRTSHKGVWWACRCVCGRRIKRPATYLKDVERHKRVSSCGCQLGDSNIKDHVFGSLTANMPVEGPGDRWSCTCVCSREIIVRRKSLVMGRRDSCGCDGPQRNKGRWRGHGDISGTIWSKIRKSAEARNLEFSISIEEAWKLFLAQDRQCALTGLPLVMPDWMASRYPGSRFKVASLDRIDNSKGYVTGNIQWVAVEINLMKLENSQEGFIELCQLVVNYAKGTQ